MSKQTITFPVAIGDTVRCVVEDENHVTDIVRYKVCGLAFRDGKYYAIDEEGALSEIGSRFCVVLEDSEACDGKSE